MGRIDAKLLTAVGALVAAILIACLAVAVYGYIKKDKKKVLIAAGVLLIVVLAFNIALAVFLSSINLK